MRPNFVLVRAALSFPGVVQLCQGHTSHFNWSGSETDPTKIAASFYSGLFAYTGWNNLNFIIEEMKNPVRDLPRAIGISCTLCTVIYVLTIVAFHTTFVPFCLTFRFNPKV